MRRAHRSDRAGQAGSVELWPLAPVEDKEDPPPWRVPAERIAAKSAPQRLADSLADWISHEVAGGVMLPSRGRALAPGDVLILLRRRNEFGRALVRALKRRGVPVAGLDRMVLTEQPAVADLLALCDTLLLPQDDLSLACVLTSPLGGLTDDSLMELAADRAERHLWDTLRRRAAQRAEWAGAHAMLTELFARVDYATPHALLAEALGEGGGRARLLARLGEEAAEPIDELLAAALTYQQTEPPSLQGFLHWLRRSAAEIKREAHAEGGGMVRIMTVHGAKGLQAPLVILPDTTAMPQDDGPLMWATPEGGQFDVPVWSPVKELRCVAVDALRQAAAARRTREYNRLLYVALTRAEDRLVVCGYETRRAPPDGCWYRLVERGFARPGPGARGAGRRRFAIQVLSGRQAGPRRCRKATRAGRALAGLGRARSRLGSQPAARRAALAAAACAQPPGRRRRSGRCRPPPRRWHRQAARERASVAASCCTRCCSICPTCPRLSAPLLPSVSSHDRAVG